MAIGLMRSASYAYQPYNQMTATSNATMSYDSNGNMNSRSQGASSWSYVWDHENRMKSATSGATSVAYAYDALGRRVRRTQGTQITKFTYDGLDVVMDDVNGTLTKYQNGPGIDNKLKLVTGTTSKYFVSDHLGSTNALTSSTGTILEQTSYDSFGNASNASFSSRYQFTGREFDSFTGLYFYRARWYDANIGRFISEDPIGFAGGDVNLYGYVWNSPMNFYDPLGLWAIKGSFYKGWGGSFSFGRDNGKWFIKGSAGVGLGAGISFLPDGGLPSSPKTECDCGGPRAWIGFSGNLGASLGPAAIFGRYYNGLLVTNDCSGKIQAQNLEDYGWDRSLKGRLGWGVSAVGSGGVDMGLAW